MEFFKLFNLGRGNVTLPLCWFSLNNSETVKAVTLIFCSIQYHFTKYNRVKFGISNSDTGQNLDGGISNFWISGQSLIKENCHNSRTSDDIDMKLEPVTKLEGRRETTLKKLDDDVMSENCDITVIFPIFDHSLTA